MEETENSKHNYGIVWTIDGYLPNVVRLLVEFSWVMLDKIIYSNKRITYVSSI